MLDVSVDIPADLRQQLEHEGGRAARLSLTLTGSMFAAKKIRDGEAMEPRATQLYTEVQGLLDSIADTPGADPISTVDDARAIVAAAVVIQAAAGEEDAKALLPEAAQTLTTMANETRPEPDSYRSGPGTLWDMGADRSAATALPMLLLSDDLLAVGGVSRADIATALERLAGSVSREVRARLTGGLAAVWATGCADDDPQQANHAAALAVYREWLLSAGIGPWNGRERPRVRLSEPLATALEQPGLLDLSAASDALPGLKTAAACGCEHGATARATLTALTEHDLRTWPTDWARRYYLGSGAWRSGIDAQVAANALAGDDAMLGRYLDGFAAVPEQLTGLMTALAEQATSREQGQRLFAVWPTILDRLLPGARHVVGPGEKRPSWHATVDLDMALLPKRPDAAPWPPQPWVAGLVARWMDAFAPSPRLCDRLIGCLISFGQAITTYGVGLILQMLGNDANRILSDSQYVTYWLRLVLLERPEGLDTHRPALRELLDDLAVKGSANAIQIQRELEA
jgi:hypothetical protein